MKNRLIKGFTLVEIMIVVAIIALLAALAIPGFLRARQRAQASTILNDARVLDGAVNQRMTEGYLSTIDEADPVITAYFKEGSRFQDSAGGPYLDILDNPYIISTDGNVTVDTATKTFFDGVIEDPLKFWSGY